MVVAGGPGGRMAEYFGVELGGGVRVALSVGSVEEVLQLSAQEICPIPGVADWLVGICNYHGQPLWVLQLAQFLELPVPPTPPETYTAVLLRDAQTNAQRHVAGVVHRLEGMVNLDTLAPLPSNLSPRLRTLFQGLAQVEEHRWVVLEPAGLFATLQQPSLATL